MHSKDYIKHLEELKKIKKVIKMNEYDFNELVDKYNTLKYEWDNYKVNKPWQNDNYTGHYRQDNTYIPSGQDDVWYPIDGPIKKEQHDPWKYEYFELTQRINKIEATLAKIEEFLNKFFDTKIAG